MVEVAKKIGVPVDEVLSRLEELNVESVEELLQLEKAPKKAIECGISESTLSKLIFLGRSFFRKHSMQKFTNEYPMCYFVFTRKNWTILLYLS